MPNLVTKQNIPKGWESKKLDDYIEEGVIKLSRGNVISKKDIAANPGTNPIYSSSIHNNGLFGTYSDHMFDEELITWSVDGGGNFFYRPQHKFSVTNVSGILKADTNKFDYRFLAYQLEWEHRNFNFDYQSKAHPSVIRQLYTISRPPLIEQKNISEILGTLDDEIKKTGEIIAVSKKLKRGLMRKLFNQGKLTLLDSIATRGSGHTPSKQHAEYWNGGIKWVSLTDSSKLDNRYIFETSKEISEIGIENSSAVLHSKNTVIVCRDAAIGRVAILGTDGMAVSQHFIAWRCSEELQFRYLYYWLQSQRSVLEQIASGTTIKTIGLSFFKGLKLPLPSIREQEKVGDIFWTIDEKISANQKLKVKLALLKKGLMQDLLSGKKRTV